MKLFIVGAFSKFIDLVESVTAQISPFVEKALAIFSKPVGEALAEAFKDIPILGFVADLISGLLDWVFDDLTLLQVCIGSGISMFILLHVVSFLNKVLGNE